MREEGRERENTDVKEKHQSVASHCCPDWESNPQPRYMSWLGIKPVNYSCVVQCSNQLSKPARATLEFLRSIKLYMNCWLQGLAPLTPAWLKIQLYFLMVKFLLFLYYLTFFVTKMYQFPQTNHCLTTTKNILSLLPKKQFYWFCSSSFLSAMQISKFKSSHLLCLLSPFHRGWKLKPIVR